MYKIIIPGMMDMSRCGATKKNNRIGIERMKTMMCPKRLTRYAHLPYVRTLKPENFHGFRPAHPTGRVSVPGVVFWPPYRRPPFKQIIMMSRTVSVIGQMFPFYICVGPFFIEGRLIRAGP